MILKGRSSISSVTEHINRGGNEVNRRCESIFNVVMLGVCKNKFLFKRLAVAFSIMPHLSIGIFRFKGSKNTLLFRTLPTRRSKLFNDKRQSHWPYVVFFEIVDNDSLSCTNLCSKFSKTPL